MCCPRSAIGKALCCLLILVIVTAIVIGIIAIVIATTFKMPTFEYQYALATEKLPNYSMSPPKLEMQWKIGVAVTNNNTFKIEITSGTVTIDLAESPGAFVGTSELGYQAFPGNGEKTVMTPVVDFIWYKEKDPDLKVLSIIAASCSPGGPKVKAVYKMKGNFKINGLGPFPVPEISQKVDQPCPVNLATMTANLGQILNSMNILV
jgi:hypothetical protein